MYEVHSTLFIKFLTNYAGNMFSTRIISKEWKRRNMVEYFLVTVEWLLGLCTVEHEQMSISHKRSESP